MQVDFISAISMRVTEELMKSLDRVSDGNGAKGGTDVVLTRGWGNEDPFRIRGIFRTFPSLLFGGTRNQETVILADRPNVLICPAAPPTLVRTFYLVGWRRVKTN